MYAFVFTLGVVSVTIRAATIKAAIEIMNQLLIDGDMDARVTADDIRADHRP